MRRSTERLVTRSKYVGIEVKRLISHIGKTMKVKRKASKVGDVQLVTSLESEIKQYLLNYPDGVRRSNIKVELNGVKKTYHLHIHEFRIECDEKLLNVIAKRNKFRKNDTISKECLEAQYLYELFKNCDNISFVRPLFYSKNTAFYKKAEGIQFDKLMNPFQNIYIRSPQ